MHKMLTQRTVRQIGLQLKNMDLAVDEALAQLALLINTSISARNSAKLPPDFGYCVLDIMADALTNVNKIRNQIIVLRSELAHTETLYGMSKSLKNRKSEDAKLNEFPKLSLIGERFHPSQ